MARLRRQPGDTPIVSVRHEVADRLRRLAALGVDEIDATRALANATAAGRVPVAVTSPDGRMVLVHTDGSVVELVDHRDDRHRLDPRSDWRPVDGSPLPDRTVFG